MKIAGLFGVLLSMVAATALVQPTHAVSWWDVQSVDTMKYSRDLSREKLNDSSFDAVIAQQMKDIVATGATHVAIATPYDEEFFPLLKRWVAAARKEGLHVWFRGNWSGWEGWFNYPRITRAEHTAKTKQFLSAHADIFEDGDIFSACPECENGGPGDPRTTGDIAGYRSFITSEYAMTKAAFHSMGKDVASNWQSMNADVARVVMDPATTQAMDGLVVIDHYVKDPKQIAADISSIAAASGGKVALGEFGAPIPDIHGKFTEKQQADWLSAVFQGLLRSPSIVGVSYWVNVGGSTQLWNDDLSPRAAVDVLRSYYSPSYVTGKVTGAWGRGVSGARVLSLEDKVVTTDKQGMFALPYTRKSIEVEVSAPGYTTATQVIQAGGTAPIHIKLEKRGFFYSIQQFFCTLMNTCTDA